MRASAVILLAFLLTISFSTSLAKAIFVIHNIIVSERGDRTILTLTIERRTGGMECDYVTGVAVRLDGGEPIVYDIDPPQSAIVFTVEIDLGVLESEPKAEVSISGTSTGWSPWFEPFGVPEFPLIQATLLFMVSTMVVASLRRFNRRKL